MSRKFYRLDEAGRICLTADKEEPGEENPLSYEFPEGFPFRHQREYKIVDGELVHEPMPEMGAVPTHEQRIAELEEALARLLSGVTE